MSGMTAPFLAVSSPISFINATPSMFSARYCRDLLISPRYVTSNLSDFPLFCQFTNDARLGIGTMHQASVSDCRPHDLIFLDPLTGHPCPHEIAYWSGGYGRPVTAGVWVKVPTISAGQWTRLQMFYGRAEQVVAPYSLNGAYAPSSVWTSASYVGVYHLGDTAGLSLTDSSGATGTLANTGVTATAGIVSTSKKAAYFNGSSYLKSGSQSSVASAFTVSCWVTVPSSWSTSWPQILTLAGDTDGMNGFNLYVNNQYSTRLWSLICKVGSASWTADWAQSGTATAGSMFHLMGTRSGATLSLYVNGSLIASGGATSGSLTYNGTPNIQIGSKQSNYCWTGTIDEARVASVAKSAAWAKFEYHNIADSGNCLVMQQDRELGSDLSLLVSLFGGGGPFPHYIRRLHNGGFLS